MGIVVRNLGGVQRIEELEQKAGACLAVGSRMAKDKQPPKDREDQSPASDWRGQETRPGAGGSETPEAAASRAEGNAPVNADDEARRTAEADRSVSRQDPPHRRPAAGADDKENAEEKRRAAAEEHSTSASRRAPHGKL
jgi:hypothetical protein